VIERIDVAAGRVTGRLSGGEAHEVTGLAVSGDGSLLYEAINTSLTVIEWDASTANVLHEVNLAAVAGGGVEAGPGTVWVHYATGMADAITGLRAADLSQVPTPIGVGTDGFPERLGSAVVDKTLLVIGLRRAGCVDAATGQMLATFDFPFGADTTPWAVGTDGMFGVSHEGLTPVAIPPSCPT